jgi:amino acid transporter
MTRLQVGSIVGSGIFASPGVVLASVNASGTALLIWCGAGLLATCGASSFAELGVAIPVNGGPQAYLQYSFGPLMGYLYAWTSITALQVCSSPKGERY